MSLLGTIGKILLIIISISGVIIFIFSLKNPNKAYTEYLHEDTTGFGYTKFNFDSKKIANYKYKGVVFVPHFMKTGGYGDNQMYNFYYRVFSKEKKNVSINSISLGREKITPNMEISINKLKKEKFLGMFWTKSLLYSNITPSIEVSKKELDTFINKNGNIESTLRVTIDNQVKSFIFEIKPTEIQDTYFHVW